MNHECINASLLSAIDCGLTLVTPPTDWSDGYHKRSLIDIEMGRLPYIYDIAVANGMPDAGIEYMIPEFPGDLAAFVMDDDAIRLESYYATRNATWPSEMVEADKTYRTRLSEVWCSDWALSYARKSDEIMHRFFKIYFRYVAYMMLELDAPPVALNDILIPFPWTDECPDSEVVLQYERDLAARYPPLMKSIEHYFTTGPPPSKRSRNRGTSWDLAESPLVNDELSTLKRSLALPSLGPVAREVMESLERAIDHVVVETRQRGQNAMKHVKSEHNQRRSDAPVLRYSHPLVTRDVLDTVLNLQGKKKNMYGDKAATRVTMVCCLLYIHCVPVDLWVQSSHFPRPPKRV